MRVKEQPKKQKWNDSDKQEWQEWQKRKKLYSDNSKKRKRRKRITQGEHNRKVW